MTIEPIVNNLREGKKIKTIIYVGKKDLAVTLWGMLRWSDKVAVHYSSLTTATKRRTEKKFRNGDVHLVIATIGFGMVNQSVDF